MADLDVLTFSPLYPEETEAAIRLRWQEWANEGLDPATDVDVWTPTHEGSWFWVATTPGIRETAREYDLMGSEVLASIFPQHSWGEYLDEHAELRGVDRRVGTPATGIVTFTGTPGFAIIAGTTVGVEPSGPGAEAPEYTTDADAAIGVSGEVDVAVTCTQIGEDGNVAGGAVDTLLTPLQPNITAVSNALEMTGGTNVEGDPSLRDRTVESFEGSAVANVRYYTQLLLNVAGIGRVTVLPVANGPGTVKIIVATLEGDPVSAATLAEAQALVDPVAGQGQGDGQTGATITVETATLLGVIVSATVEPEPGYSLEGEGGTIALRESIEAATADYVNQVLSGGEVVRQHVIGRIVSVEGVHDVGSVTINAVAGNLAVPSTPAYTPTLITPMSLTEGVV